jgi:hypothetical protein
MAWTKPKTWVTGERLSAFDFNTYLRSNMQALYRAADERFTDSWTPRLDNGNSNVWEIWGSMDVVIPYAGSAWVIVEHGTVWGNLAGSGFSFQKYTLDGAAIEFAPESSHYHFTAGWHFPAVFGAVFHVTSGPTTLQLHTWYFTTGEDLDINTVSDTPVLVRVMTLVS